MGYKIPIMAIEQGTTVPESVFISAEVPIDHTDGASNTLRQILPLLKDLKIDGVVVSPSKQGAITNPFYPETTTAIVSWGDWSDLIEQGEPPDIFHAFAPINIGLTGIEEAKRKKIPVITSFNTNVPEYVRFYGPDILSELAWRVYKYTHNQADINLAPSPSVKDEMERHGIHHVEVWGRGVDNTLFSPTHRNMEMRSRLTSGHPDKPICLYVGRFAKEKNLEVFLPIIQSLPDTQFVFVGSGPLEQKLKTLLASDNVTFVHQLPHGKELADIYASSDIFITPSLTEGYPNTVLEAEASGVPVIGFEALGVGDIIKESHGGLFSKPGDVADIIENIQFLLQNSSLHHDLGINGRNYAVAHTWDVCFQRLLGYYESVMLSKIPKPEDMRDVAKLLDDMTNIYYLIGRASRKIRVMDASDTKLSLQTRITQVKLAKSTNKGKLTTEQANSILATHTEFDRQFANHHTLSVDMGDLGIQTVKYVDIYLSPTGPSEKPVFIIPGRSGDFYGIAPFIRALALKGKRVISVSYPESYLGLVSSRFTHAVKENRSAYTQHSLFFKATLKEILGDQDFELWGYSAGAAILAEILSDPEYSGHVCNAVAINPASSADQSRFEFLFGIGQEVGRLLTHIQEIPLTSDVVGPKSGIAYAQRRRRKEIRDALNTLVRKNIVDWRRVKVKPEGKILVVTGSRDFITKGARTKLTQGLYLEDQINILNYSDGSHLTPLTHADEYMEQIEAQLSSNVRYQTVSLKQRKNAN